MASLAAITVAVPLYAESATSRLLGEQVDAAETDRQPFGYLFSWSRLSTGNQSWSAFEPVHDFLGPDGASFGSAVDSTERFVRSVPFELYLGDDLRAGADGAVRIDTLSFTSVQQIADVAVSAGRAPTPAGPDDDSVEVMVSEALAGELGLSVGQSLTVVNTRAEPGTAGWATSVVLSGLWTAPARDERPEDRFQRNSEMRDSLVVPEQTMVNVVDQLGDGAFAAAQWLVLVDSGRVSADNVDGLLQRTDGITRAVDDRLAGVRLLISPESALEGFQGDVARLNRGLASFSLPIVVLVAAVTMLVIGMRHRRRRAEFSTLRQRGVRPGPLFVAAIVEAVVLAAVAALGAVGLARLIARTIGQTETFLLLGGDVDLALVFNARAVRALWLVALVLVGLQLLPMFGALRARDGGSSRTDNRAVRPWWQRSGADVGIVALVGFFTWFVLRSDAVRGSLLDEPVAILLPAGVALAAGLVLLRVFPLLMGGLARVIERTSWTAPLLAVRRAARLPGATAAPLLLLVLTGALSVYTASLARTLDLQLADQAHHLIGAANSVTDDPGDANPIFSSPFGQNLTSGPPVDAAAFGRIWGLPSSTRLAQLPARVEGIGGGETIAVQFTGVDPATFAATAFWRDDYARQSLPALMAGLDATRDGVLMHESVLRTHNLRVGDEVTVSVSEGDQSVRAPMVIVGSFAQFPTWTGTDGLPPLVASLPDFEQRLGRSVTRQVLFSDSEGFVDEGQTRADLNRLGVRSNDVRSAAELIERAQTQPARQGVFGLLTVSFVLSSLLTVGGFVLYAAAGIRAQMTELGILRALGLRLRSLLSFVGLDLLLVVIAGLGTAVTVGVLMARHLLPRLVGSANGAAPALLPEFDWVASSAIGGALLATFLVVVVILLSVLRRLRLFEAVKLGGDGV